MNTSSDLPIRASSCHSFFALMPGLVSAALAGCTTFSVTSPADNAVIVLPSPASVVVAASGPFTGLTVNVDGTDFSSLMSPTGSTGTSTGNLPLGLGTHSLTATANVSCSYCSAGFASLSQTKSFLVTNPGTCVRAGAPPIITLTPQIIAVGKTIGRQLIAYYLKDGHDVLLIVVDDAPGLVATSMIVSVDIDPVGGVTDSKIINAYHFCHIGPPVASVQVTMGGGINVGVACAPLTAANNFTSGCTVPSPPMTLSQATTGELWLSNGSEIEGIDASVWAAFGGRKVRFIWRGE
jgi:hypothetical protein